MGVPSKQSELIRDSCTSLVVGRIKMKTVFVANLDYGTTERTLYDHFSKVGKVVEVRIPTQKVGGGIGTLFGRGSRLEKTMGYAFVDMEEGSERAIAELHDQQLDGRRLLVEEAKKGEINA